MPFHPERVWSFNSHTGLFAATLQSIGLHITHNGDFDALEVRITSHRITSLSLLSIHSYIASLLCIQAYSQTMVVDEVGLWLERVLHVSNNCRGPYVFSAVGLRVKLCCAVL